ncbi:outer membrane protein assembly factor BamB family protein [Actinoplanes sp. URMC 104]|uniref:outer membrane protein assembly factor BamB family protein n=1 Tax=Actinoplanes sp. URMC 104 TaxID=3423409 RepID=UPI003F1E3CCC
MPADLEELFGGLGRAADTIPLVPAERARRRGEQRTRNQAAVAAAVVVLVAVGVLVGLRVQRQQTHPADVVRPLPPVGAPIGFGEAAVNVSTAIAGDRAYTSWRTADGWVRVVAADLRTGARSWTARTVARSDDYSGVAALPQAVAVFVVPDGDDVPSVGTTANRRVHVLDPLTGRERWKRDLGGADDVLLNSHALVRMAAGTGRTEAYDWLTGAIRWSVPPGTDRPVRTVAVREPDEQHGAVSTDDRLVQVTEAGRVRVVHVADGQAVPKVTIPAPGQADTHVAYGDILYNSERSGGTTSPWRVRATDLGTLESWVVLTLPAGHDVDSMWPCGYKRLCVMAMGRAYPQTTVRSVDVAERRTVWQLGDFDGGYGGSMGEHTLIGTIGQKPAATLYDSAGRPVYVNRTDAVDWLGTDALLVQPLGGPGLVQRVRLTDGRATALGWLPAPAAAHPAGDAVAPCVHNGERLVCPSSVDVRIFSLTG